jgi:S-(hydroxymethyl)glutathione dehydrogenase/alcohol dehydrogenase
MKVTGAVCHAIGTKWSIEELSLHPPLAGEVLVRVEASGLCHSDDHIVTGDLAFALPMVGGHEGAGVVEAVGPGVSRVHVGDHVCTAYIPSCGTCAYCSRGLQYLCDRGAGIDQGRMLDGTARFYLGDDRPLGALCRLGTFADHTVLTEEQCIKIPESIPFDVACLVSCGVATGWGSAVNVAAVRPGQAVMVVGLGGVGANALQGAAAAGAAHLIGVDPNEWKHEVARRLGATNTFVSMAEALPFVESVTNGQGVDACIVTVGRVDGRIIGDAFQAVGKAGTCVVTAVGQHKPGIAVNPVELTNLAKSIKGVMFGNCNPTYDIPMLLGLYQQGQLRLDELVTRTYRLDELNDAYADMYAGRIIRGVLRHQHAAPERSDNSGGAA